MEEAMRILSLILVFGLSTIKVSGSNPCISNAVLGNQADRCPSVTMSGFGLCDRFITETWYRVDDGADLPTACPHPYQCNTQYPVWMTGPVPTVGEGEVTRSVCVSSTQGCCGTSWTIRVKNCGNFRVYFLKQTDYCPSAYCLEKKMYSTTTLDSSNESSASSSSQDMTSTSTENTESVTNDVSNETDTDDTSYPPSTGSTHSTTTKAQTDDVINPVLTTPPDVTQSHVLEEDSPDVMVYVLVAVVGFLCLIISIIIVVLWRSKRNKRDTNVVQREDSTSNKRESRGPANCYSDMPDTETIYYSIDHSKETENNIENEKRASAHDRNLYIDPIQDEDFTYDEAKEVDHLNKALQNGDMYLKMGSKNRDSYMEMGVEKRDMYKELNRKSLQTSTGNDVTQKSTGNSVSQTTADTVVDPYEGSSNVEECHDYARLPTNGNSNELLGYTNAAYKAEKNDTMVDSVEENGSRLSAVSYDDVTVDVI